MTRKTNQRVSQYRDAQPGELFQFGHYPQAAEGGDRTPITWVVLDRSETDILALSSRILDCRRFHEAKVATTWRDSTIRRWLSRVFFTTAFSSSEQALIAPRRCRDNGPGTPDTVDRVFLLSVAEVRTLTSPGAEGPAVDRRAMATEYARHQKSDGARLYVYDMTVAKDYLLVDGVRAGCSWWWLRSQPKAERGTDARAAFVGARGDVKSYGRVDLPYYGVRPALCLSRAA